MSTLTLNESSDTVISCLNHTLYPWTKQGTVVPEQFVKAEGVYVYTVEKRYLDFSSQLVNMNLGHTNPKITKAVSEQMEQMAFITPGAATTIKSRLGAKLAQIAPGNLNKTFYTVGGAEANENAIKMARLVTGRHKIVSLYRSYHGATYGAISAGGDPRKFAVDVSAMPHVVHVENPYSYRCPWKTTSAEACKRSALENLERVIQFEGETSIAAILLEGESGSSGCIKYPEGYWKGVETIAKKYGILTIADEVMSGFGRTGKWFAVQHHNVVPDMITMAKGLTGGYLPLGGIIVSDVIANYFQDNVLPLGLTNAAHPVCLAAALAAIETYEEKGALENATIMGNYLSQKLRELKNEHPSIGDVRITGLLGCIELVKNKLTREPLAPFNAKPHEMIAMNEVAAELKSLGMFTLVRWNYIFIAPPIIINSTELDEGIEIINQALFVADKFCE